MIFIECGYDLGIDHDQFIYNHIRNKRSYEMAFEMDGDPFLLFDCVSPFLKLNDQRILVELLIQARLEIVENHHRSPNDFLTQFFVYKIFQQ